MAQYALGSVGHQTAAADVGAAEMARASLAAEPSCGGSPTAAGYKLIVASARG